MKGIICYPGSSELKNPPANAVDAGMIPGLERPHEEGNDYPL